MKKKFLPYILICGILCACSNTPQTTKVELSNVKLLDTAEVIYETNDKFPVSLLKRDSLLFVILMKSDTCINVIDLNSKTLLKSFGNKGVGGDELLNPNFILSTDTTSVLLEVGNLRKLVDIDYQNIDSIKMTNLKYPESIYIASEMNISNNYIVGRIVESYSRNMFFIYDQKNEARQDIACYPPLKVSKTFDYNYVYATNLALNEKKNRIISGMYFFDMFHVYDLQGNRLNTFSLSNNCYPKTDRDKGVNINNLSSKIIRAYPTEEHCYLLRLIDTTPRQYMLIQTDWEGTIKNTYKFPDEVSGQFCVDEKNKNVYLIRNYLNDIGEDIFAIVAYSLG